MEIAWRHEAILERRPHRAWLDRAGVFLIVSGLVVAIAAGTVSRNHAVERKTWVCKSCGARNVATKYLKIPFGTGSTTQAYEEWVRRTVPAHTHRWVYSNTYASGWRGRLNQCAEPEHPHYLPELYAKRSADPRVAELLIDCIREFESGPVDTSAMWQRAHALDEEPQSPGAPERRDGN